MATVYAVTEDYSDGADISAELTTGNGAPIRDTVRIKLGYTVIRLNIAGAVDLVDAVVTCLAQIEPEGGAA